MEIRGNHIGVCSWSLRPAGLEDLIEKVHSLGLSHVQLLVGDLVDLPEAAQDRAIGLVRDSGLTLTATMIGYPGEDYASINAIRRTGGLVPDEMWDERRQRTLAAADLSAKFGVTMLTTHIGFIPSPNHRDYGSLIERIDALAGPLAERGIELLMETGQESANELLQFVNNLKSKNFGVNFDPANMILYGSGDPIDAIKTLGRRVRHVHVKDATRSRAPGVEWGSEVAFGDGEVPHAAFASALKSIDYAGPLVIEREAGDDRLADVQYAIETLQELG